MTDSMPDPSAPERLAALRRYDILDSPDEEAFDRIAELTAQLFDVPMTGIHFVDEACQWAKSQVGLDAKTLGLDVSFCVHGLDSDAVMVVPDATEDPRFADNPLVTGAPGIRFYAGAPLVTPDGYILGSLCVIDTAPQPAGAFDEDDRQTLRKLADVVMDELEYRAQPRHREEVLESITDAFFAVDDDWRFTYLNEQAETLLLRSRDELLGQNMWEQFPEAVELEFHDQYHRAVETGESVQFEAYFPPLETWFRVSAYPFEDGLSVYFDDVTEEKERERALRETRKMLDRVIGTANMGICVTDEEGRFVRVNEAYTALYGWSEDELIGEPFTKVVPEADRARAQALHDRFIYDAVDEASGEWTVQRKDGTRRQVLVTAGRLVNEDGARFKVTTVLDITERKRAEQALQEREQYLSVTLNSIGDAVITTDADGRVDEMNTVAEELTGWSREEAVGQPLTDVFPIYNAKTGAPVESPVDEVLREGQIVGMANHTMLAARDGTKRQIADSAAPIRTADGDLLGVVMVFRDVTQAYRRREALKAERERLELALIGGELGMWDWNMNTDEVTYDTQWAAMLGYDLDEVEGTEAFFAAHTHPDDLARVRADVERHAAGEIPFIDLEIRMRHKDGSWRWILDRGKILEWNEDGTPRRMLGTHMDITERREAENALRRQHNLLEQTQRLAGAWEYDLDSGVISWSDEIYRIHEVPPGTTIRIEDGIGYYAPAARPVIREAVDRAVAEGEPWDLELPLITAEGNRRWVRSVGTAIENDAGEVVKLAGAFQDITERHKVQQALASSRERLARAQELVSLGSWERDFAHDTLHWSDETRRIFGWGLDEAVSYEAFMKTVHPDDRNELRRQQERAMAGEGNIDIEYRIRRADGEERIIHERGEADFDAGGTLLRVTGTVLDVTEERAAEEQMRLLEAAVQNAADSILITEAAFDEPGPRIVYANPAFERATGYAEDEVLGRTPRVLQGDATDRAPLDRMRQAFEQWEPVRETVLNYQKDGTPFWNELYIAPVADEDGWYTHWVSVQRDVTERKRREQELVEAKATAEEMNRLKSAFLANMSHEIRTPLTAIIGFTDVLSGMVEDQALELLEMIRESGRRLEQTLTSVLDLAQLESEAVQFDPEPMNLAAEIRTAIDLFRQKAAEKEIELAADLPEQPIEATLDAGALQRTLSNLLSNAVKFTEEGHVCVRLRREGDEAIIQVEDTGIGIDPEQAERIFEEFTQESEGYTRDYEGVGLGLSITQRLVKLLDGTIRVASTKGQGSVFTVVLPCAPAPADPAVRAGDRDGDRADPEAPEAPAASAPADAPADAASPAAANGRDPVATGRRSATDTPDDAGAGANAASDAGTTRVLLVEDNDLTREVLPLLLQEADRRYAMEAAAHPDEALRMAQDRTYDLFLIDINLGADRTGVDVMEALRAMPAYERAAMVACTAYAMPGDEEHFLDAGFDAYLAKPFRANDLIAVLESV